MTNTAVAKPITPAGKITPMYAASHVDHAVTGTLSSTALWTLVIPGGTVGANAMIRVTTLWEYTNSSNTKNLRVKLSTTAFANVAVTTTASVNLATCIQFRNSVSSQIGGPANSGGGYGGSTSALVTAALDFSQDQTLTIEAQLTNTGETITLRAVTVEVIQ